METGLLHLHNILRWVVLLTAAWALIRGASGLAGRRAYTATDRRAALFFLISAHLQLVLGLTLYFTRGWAAQLASAGSALMTNKALRFWAVEHMAGMILGILFITIGYSSAKRAKADRAKFSRWFWWSVAGIIAILVTIPWPGREEVGRSLLPGMGE